MAPNIRGLVVILARQIQHGRGPVHVAVVVIGRQRDLQLRSDLLKGDVAIRGPPIGSHLAQHACFQA
jgi:hypothetical protein